MFSDVNQTLKWQNLCRYLRRQNPVFADFSQKITEKRIFFEKKFGGKDFLLYLCTRNQVILKSADASLAQLVEHDTLNVGVQGSSP